MTLIITFYVLLAIVFGLLLWAFFMPHKFPFPFGRIVFLAGAIVLLASLLLLPWITADPQDIRTQNLAWLRTKPNPWWPERTLIAIREKLFPDPTETFDLNKYLCDTLERKRWCNLIENHTSLSAWELLREAPTFSLLFKVTLWARLALSTGILVASIASPLFHLDNLDLRLKRALASLAMILLVLALFQIPGADTLGLRQEFKLDYINLLAGIQTSGGMWWSLAGLALIVLGWIVEDLDLI